MTVSKLDVDLTFYVRTFLTTSLSKRYGGLNLFLVRALLLLKKKKNDIDNT